MILFISSLLNLYIPRSLNNVFNFELCSYLCSSIVSSQRITLVIRHFTINNINLCILLKSIVIELLIPSKVMIYSSLVLFDMLSYLRDIYRSARTILKLHIYSGNSSIKPDPYNFWACSIKS